MKHSLALPAWLAPVAIAFVFVAYAKSALQYPVSTDLLPLWMAASAFGAGQFDQVYTGSDGVFTLVPPDTWPSAVLALEGVDARDAEVLPYLYPPLWAAVVSPLTKVANYPALQSIFNIANPFMMVGIVWLAWRMYPVVSLTRHMAIGLLTFVTTMAGAVAIMSSQIQILVAFLTLLAFERHQRGAMIACGVALAFAAALKCFPALFVVFLIAHKSHRAALAFAITGGALGLLSIGLAGWPLHMAFLAELAAVSKTVVVVNIATGLDVLLTQIFAIDSAKEVGPRVIIVKSILWQYLSKAGLLAALALFAWIAQARIKTGLPAIYWPAMLACVTLLSPLAWAFYFLIPLAFAPVFLTQMRSALLGLGVIASGNIMLLHLPSGILGLSLPAAVIATLGLIVLAGLLTEKLLKDLRTPLHVGAASL
ncbi:MAG: glycosyltransferase family 87 protein [Pseudomonadota bacterium]